MSAVVISERYRPISDHSRLQTLSRSEHMWSAKYPHLKVITLCLQMQHMFLFFTKVQMDSRTRHAIALIHTSTHLQMKRLRSMSLPKWDMPSSIRNPQSIQVFQL